ncbi:MAG: AAA family ATPase, partial [Oscillospiraceae bacterium]
MNRKKLFPFTAVVAQEKLKLALILNVINPGIGGVLISGEKGTAKSTLVRGLAQLLSDMSVIEVPLNITEDRLVGTLKLTDTLKDGMRHIEYGILHNADGQFLYIDEVNLLSAHISNIIAEVASRGENIIERDGISFCHRCRFIPVGTMNPEEGFLRPQLLDKFGLFASAFGEQNISMRSEIVSRYLKYEKNPIEYYLKFADKEKLLFERISAARSRLPDVKITDENLGLAALISHNAGCEGNRCEIILIEAARALAAWNDEG